jgi:hypothetical protein
MTRVIKRLPKKLRAALTSLTILACLSVGPTDSTERRIVATAQNAGTPVRPSSLQRFAFIDSTSPAARTALVRHTGDLDGLIGEWLTANVDGTIAEADDPEQDDASIASPWCRTKATRMASSGRLRGCRMKSSAPGSSCRSSAPSANMTSMGW